MNPNPRSESDRQCAHSVRRSSPGITRPSFRSERSAQSQQVLESSSPFQRSAVPFTLPAPPPPPPRLRDLDRLLDLLRLRLRLLLRLLLRGGLLSRGGLRELIVDEEPCAPVRILLRPRSRCQSELKTVVTGAFTQPRAAYRAHAASLRQSNMSPNKEGVHQHFLEPVAQRVAASAPDVLTHKPEAEQNYVTLPRRHTVMPGQREETRQTDTSGAVARGMAAATRALNC